MFHVLLFSRPKHPTVGAGISRRGRTGICIFDGIMKKELYVEILEQTLLPFIHTTFPDTHKLMQDNDPKHTSLCARNWMEQNAVVWWKTPPESPDLKNLWHELKEYIRREVKPEVKQELVDGILEFWRDC